MRKLSILLSSIISLGAFGSFDVQAAPKCAQKTLKGTYIYNSQGVHNGNLAYASGKELYDGEGHVINTFTNSSGQTISLVGVYVVSSSCTGRVDYSTGNSYAIYLNPNGASFTFIDTSLDPNDTMSGVETRVSTALIK
jgi:hypothetical protein